MFNKVRFLIFIYKMLSRVLLIKKKKKLLFKK